MTMRATDAITSRRSIRAFRADPVDPDVLRTILTDAARAASGTNIQPWKVYVLEGRSRDDLIDAVQSAFDAGESSGDDNYYPSEFIEPFKSRRRKIGWDMYGLIGIERGEYEKMAAHARRNYQFFDAPIGLIFTLHKTMRSGGWLDLGLYMANVMTLAREHGLHTCPQAAWQEFDHVVHTHLELPDDEVVTVGMALGHEDTDAVINELRTERAPLDDFVEFRG
ncbi:MAG: nitroreductase [Acidimicrobiales bacterium]